MDYSIVGTANLMKEGIFLFDSNLRKSGICMTENKANNTTANLEDRDIVITRVFDAPRELVFKAWTDPKHLMRWWGPKGFTNTIQEVEVKPGGVWRFVMHGPDGMNYKNEIHFLEIEAPALLVYAHGGNGDEQHQVIVDFAQQEEKTKLTMRMRFNSVAERNRVVKEYGAVEGAKSTLDRLEEELAQMKNK
jgi:uncharacterized protein YndB with AHSA1/START domain